MRRTRTHPPGDIADALAEEYFAEFGVDLLGKAKELRACPASGWIRWPCHWVQATSHIEVCLNLLQYGRWNCSSVTPT